MNGKGLLFVVSAPAGCGKDTILEQLFARTDTAGYSVSATTRAPREGEVDGVHYHFKTREQFEQMIRGGEVLEYTEYCGNYYGTPKKGVEELTSQGRDVLFTRAVSSSLGLRHASERGALGAADRVVSGLRRAQSRHERRMTGL